jgi:DNA-directed RNA polymerase subunit RPC12/RpoP
MGKMIATYSCAKCGMSVNASCAKCNKPLVNDNLVLDDGSQVQISRCPQCEGKIKSPMCCGLDMSCSV